MIEKPSLLTKWAENALALPTVRVQVRLRGNQLHILCEAEKCPREDYSVARFSQALASSNIESLLPDRQSMGSRIYQIFICGRTLGRRRPDWTVKLDTNGYCPTSATFPRSALEVEKETPLTTSHLTTNNWSSGSLLSTLEEKPLVKSTATTMGESPTEVTLNTSNITGTTKLEKTSVLTAVQGPNLQITKRSTSTLTLSESTDEEGELNAKGPKEIATYLSEVLGGLGISVNVKIGENYKQKQDTEIGVVATQEAIAASNFQKSKTKKRLWVICEASYSPDPSLLAEPIAQRLRELKLRDFREASILLQVRGEARPDWMLRVDLTPSAKILQTYARWGDVEAIERIFKQELRQVGVGVKTTLKESTLHIFCSQAQNNSQEVGGQLAEKKIQLKKGRLGEGKVPDKEKTKEAIARLLSTICPQGIQAATLYGIPNQANDTKNSKATKGYSSPSWIDWLNLPASKHPDLAPDAVTLAKSGNNSALNFLLDRLLNPDLDRKLETGGVKAIVLPKADLLHVMTEAPTCPSQSKVGQSIAEFLRELQLPGVTGVRVYGRRAGQKLPLWRYSFDFVSENRSSLEAVPEFEASVADGEVSQVAVPGQQERERKKQKTSGGLSTAIQKLLLASGLFVPAGSYSEAINGLSSYSDRSGPRLIAMVWVVLGLVLALQTDSFLGRFLQISATVVESAVEKTIERENLGNYQTLEKEELPAIRGEEKRGKIDSQLPELSWRRSQENPEDIFNESGFTKASGLMRETSRKNQILTRDYPSFKSQQLDEQLVRYQDYILANKMPPDVLIIGSSRALRGIDPTVLEESLAARGYPNLKIYNFGINGATVQLVDLIIREVLLPEQLPRLILFADGVRAFNSGREDRTFEIIASSEGYQAVIEGNLQVKANQQEELKEEQKPAKIADDWLSNYALIEAWVERRMEKHLITYSQRDRLKAWLRSLIKLDETNWAAENVTETELITDEIEGEETIALTEKSGFQSNGFLPISIQFNSEIYYENHPLVSGDYDADYSNFKLKGQQTTAWQNLLRFTQARRVKVVFVNMPLTQEYLDDVRSYYEGEFREYMEQIVLDYPGLSFRDLSLLWPEKDNYFSDPSHLNRYGAIAVAEELAKETTIPWPQTDFSSEN